MSGTMFGQQQDACDREKAVVQDLKRLSVVPDDVVVKSSPTTTSVVLKKELTLTKVHEVATTLKEYPFLGISVTEGELTLHCSMTSPRAAKRRSCDEEHTADPQLISLHNDCKRASVDPKPVVAVASALRSLRGTSNEEACRAVAVDQKMLLAAGIRGGVVVSLRSLLSGLDKTSSRDGVLGVRPLANDATSEHMLKSADFLPSDADAELLEIRDLIVVVVLKTAE